MDKGQGKTEESEKAKAINPFTGEVLSEHNFLTEDEISKKIQHSWDSYLKFRKTDPQERAQNFLKLAKILEKDIDRFAKVLTMEMGKTITEARMEIESSVRECRFYAEHAVELNKIRRITETDAKETYALYQPMGPIFHITPFNFPFWLIFRGTIAAMIMGNTVINKNPQTCPQCGIVAEEAFKEAGFNNGEFMNLILAQKHSEFIIKNPLIRGVSFTGSTEGGAKIASLAGQYCKKSVMELGGNDPFIILKDADLDLAITQGIRGRLLNGGQCCTAAKRFIIDESIYDDYKNKLLQKVKTLRIGDPMEDDTIVGPLAKKSGLEKTKEQVEKAKQHGAKILYGGEQPKDPKLSKGLFFMPTVLEMTEDNPVFHEETFGPIFSLIKFKNENEAIRLGNNTQYGLGGAIFSRNEAKAKELAEELECGVVYINHMVQWDAATPEGGVKDSGYGREGGREGALEFVNVKTVWVSDPKSAKLKCTG